MRTGIIVEVSATLVVGNGGLIDSGTEQPAEAEPASTDCAVESAKAAAWRRRSLRVPAVIEHPALPDRTIVQTASSTG